MQSTQSTHYTENDEADGPGGRWFLLMVILGGCCLVIRASGVMRLPIFGDEAIYLRWAQLIRGEGVGSMHLWVSLADPKPPLHYWLLALLFHGLGGKTDPLAAGRWISVWTGVLCIPAISLVCTECGHLIRNSGRVPSGRTLGLVAAVFFIVCPFLSFYQRLATADALFLLESLVVIWLSFRWGRLASHGGKAGQVWISALALGVALGAALLTRQGLSYTLVAMPMIAWVLHAQRTEGGRSQGLRKWLLPLLQLLIAGIIAGAIWSPFLVAEWKQRALETRREAPLGGEAVPVLETGDYWKELKRRVFYQDSFTNSEGPGRLAIAARNIEWTFIPETDDRGTPVSGWLYYYLTPGVFFAGLLGLICLVVRRQWRLLIVLIAWMFLMMGPVVLLGNTVYSRYILAGVPPLLIAGSYVVADVMGTLMLVEFAGRGAVAIGTLIALLVGLIFVPMREIGRQATDWPEQTLTAKDNYQYVTGWTAGFATEHAIGVLEKLAEVGPIVVITDNGWGTPADAVWVYLSQNKNIDLYYSDSDRILRLPPPAVRTQPNSAWLRREKFLFTPPLEADLPAGVPVLYITQDRLHGIPAEEYLKQFNPNLRLFDTFYGVGGSNKDDPEGRVDIFQLNPPAAATRPGR